MAYYNSAYLPTGVPALSTRFPFVVVTYVVTKTMRIPSPCGSLAVRGTVRQQLCDWLLADGNSESNWIRREQQDAFIIADSLARSRERV